MSVAAAGSRAPRQTVAAVQRGAAAVLTVRHESPVAYFHAAVACGRPLRWFVATDPLRTMRVIRAVGRLPLLRAHLPATVDGAAIARELRSHAAVRTLFRRTTSVLDVPREPGRYSAGARRATLRRKMRSAERQGVVVRAVPPAERAELLELASEHERYGAPVEYRIAVPSNGDLPDYDLWIAAYGPDGRALALTVVPVADDWAVLRYFRTLTVGPIASDARYLLHTALVEELARRGARHLIDGVPPWWLPNGLRHFQGMLGFRLVRLQVADAR